MMLEQRHGGGRPVAARWDPEWVRRRRALEQRREGLGERLPYCALKWFLKATRLYARGYRNFLDVRVTRLEHALPGWPKGLDGFRILQVSDLHIDLDPALEAPVAQLLSGIECELAVFTGDFSECAQPPGSDAAGQFARLAACLPPPPLGRFAVLGNHDSVALAEQLEALGQPVLVNAAVTLDCGGHPIALAGVDDAYFFRLHDLAAAARACPAGLPRILLSHSPQVAPQAAAAGFQLMLSGHTHGGQVCLPGGRSLVAMETIPRPLFRGPWRVAGLPGYTTTGTGACHIPVRFNCPAEIVLHTLRAG